MEVVRPKYSVSTKVGRMARRLLLKWETLFLQEDNETVSLNITKPPETPVPPPKRTFRDVFRMQRSQRSQAAQANDTTTTDRTEATGGPGSSDNTVSTGGNSATDYTETTDGPGSTDNTGSRDTAGSTDNIDSLGVDATWMSNMTGRLSRPETGRAQLLFTMHGLLNADISPPAVQQVVRADTIPALTLLYNSHFVPMVRQTAFDCREQLRLHLFRLARPTPSETVNFSLDLGLSVAGRQRTKKLGLQIVSLNGSNGQFCLLLHWATTMLGFFLL